MLTQCPDVYSPAVLAEMWPFLLFCVKDAASAYQHEHMLEHAASQILTAQPVTETCLT